MIVKHLQMLGVTIVLMAAILGLGGCQRRETTTDTQVLPLVGGENSPLPTPGGSSPLPTPGVSDSPLTP